MLDTIHLGTPGYKELTFNLRNKKGNIVVQFETEDNIYSIVLTEEDELRLLKFFMKQ